MDGATIIGTVPQVSHEPGTEQQDSAESTAVDTTTSVPAGAEALNTTAPTNPDDPEIAAAQVHPIPTTNQRGERHAARIRWRPNWRQLALFTAFVAATVAVAPAATVEVVSGPMIDVRTATTGPATMSGTDGALAATTLAGREHRLAALAWCKLTGPCQTVPVAPSSASGEAAADSSVVAARSAAAALVGATDVPQDLTGDLGPVQGTSAGLMLTLAFAEDLTGESFTGRLRVAGTGTIDEAGTVGPIAGIALKAQAAQAWHADVFFAPTLQAGAAQAATPQLRVVPVATARDATAWLCAQDITAACAVATTDPLDASG